MLAFDSSLLVHKRKSGHWQFFFFKPFVLVVNQVSLACNTARPHERSRVLLSVLNQESLVLHVGLNFKTCKLELKVTKCNKLLLLVNIPQV